MKTRERDAERWLDQLRDAPPVTAPLTAVHVAGPRLQPEAPCYPQDQLPPWNGYTIADDITRGWSRLAVIRCAYPATGSDTPIPCDAEHRDPDAATFRDLDRSAHRAGWRIDTFGRWACPASQMLPHYRTRRPLALPGPVWEYDQRTRAHHRDSHGPGRRARLKAAAS